MGWNAKVFAFIIFQPSLLKLAGSVNASYALGTRWSSVMLPEFQVDVERRFVNIGLMRSWTDRHGSGSVRSSSVVCPTKEMRCTLAGEIIARYEYLLVMDAVGEICLFLSQRGVRCFAWMDFGLDVDYNLSFISFAIWRCSK